MIFGRSNVGGLFLLSLDEKKKLSVFSQKGKKASDENERAEMNDIKVFHLNANTDENLVDSLKSNKATGAGSH